MSLITSTSLIDFADFNVASKLSNRFQIISANLLNRYTGQPSKYYLTNRAKIRASLYILKKKKKNLSDKPYFIHFLLPPLTLVLAYFQDRTIARIFFPKRFRTLFLSMCMCRCNAITERNTLHANSGGICSRRNFINERFRHDDDDDEQEEKEEEEKEGERGAGDGKRDEEERRVA